MDYYDTFKDTCPSCGVPCEEKTTLRGDNCVFLNISPGMRVPLSPKHELTVELNPCAYCGGELFAVLQGGIFVGFAVTNDYPTYHSERGLGRELIRPAEKLVAKIKTEPCNQDLIVKLTAYNQRKEEA